MRESEGTKHASLRAESGGPLINERRYGRAGAGTENRPLSHKDTCLAYLRLFLGERISREADF